MGDVIDVTAWPKHQYTFYRITSSTISFDVKAPGNAYIGLARKPTNKCDYWICIGDAHVSRTWIRKGDDRCHSVSTPRILCRDNYKRFWLTWYGDNIKLGKDGDPKPIIIHSNKREFDLKFITFSVLGERNPVHWRFQIPPQYIMREVFQPLSDGEPEWKDANDQLPDGAIIGGFEKETLYIVRAHHRGSFTPGKFVPSEGVAYIPWGGQANEKNEFQVLCGFDYTWVTTKENRIPVGAVEGGYSEDRHETLFIGRAYHDNQLIPGKVQPSHRVCYIPYKGREVAKKIFEILVQPLSNSKYANKFFVQEMNVEHFSDSEDDANSNPSDHNDEDIDYEFNDFGDEE